jgi:hypothetical protein
MEIPRSRLVHRNWLKDRKLAVLQLGEDVEIAAMYGRHAAKLNLDASFLCCDSSGYSRTRLTASAVLLNPPARPRDPLPLPHHEQQTALVLISRSAPPTVMTSRELHILNDTEARDLILGRWRPSSA